MLKYHYILYLYVLFLCCDIILWFCFNCVKYAYIIIVKNIEIANWKSFTFVSSYDLLYCVSLDFNFSAQSVGSSRLTMRRATRTG